MAHRRIVFVVAKRASVNVQHAATKAAVIANLRHQSAVGHGHEVGVSGVQLDQIAFLGRPFDGTLVGHRFGNSRIVQLVNLDHNRLGVDCQRKRCRYVDVSRRVEELALRDTDAAVALEIICGRERGRVGRAATSETANRPSGGGDILASKQHCRATSRECYRRGLAPSKAHR